MIQDRERAGQVAIASHLIGAAAFVFHSVAFSDRLTFRFDALSAGERGQGAPGPLLAPGLEFGNFRPQVIEVGFKFRMSGIGCRKLGKRDFGC